MRRITCRRRDPSRPTTCRSCGRCGKTLDASRRCAVSTRVTSGQRRRCAATANSSGPSASRHPTRPARGWTRDASISNSAGGSRPGRDWIRATPWANGRRAPPSVKTTRAPRAALRGLDPRRLRPPPASGSYEVAPGCGSALGDERPTAGRGRSSTYGRRARVDRVSHMFRPLRQG